MATFQKATTHSQTEEDYINMEVSSSLKTGEFEFQMSSISHETQTTTTSPADDLFYKGKLLPLHLPPRLQMVQNLLQNTQQPIPIPNLPSSTNPTSPLDSPPQSCRVSCELNLDEFLFGWTSEFKGFLYDHSKKSWSKKLKQIKQSSLGQKLKSLFTKPEGDSESKEFMAKKKNPFGKIGHFSQKISASAIDGQRRSFSGVIQRKSSSSSTSSSASSSLSSSFSLSSNGFHDLQLLKRSDSANLETECSIDGAIAHCKKSHQKRTGICSI